MGEVEIALTLPSQQFDEDNPLPLRQCRDGAVQTIVLVTARSLGARIAFPGPVVDQLFHHRLAERHLSPSRGCQADALAAADGCQPRAEPVGLG